MTFVGIAGSQHQSEFNSFVGIFLTTTKISTGRKDPFEVFLLFSYFKCIA